MDRILVSILATAALAMAGGCNNSKSPHTVAGDVAKAESKASSEVANARQDAMKDESKGNYEVAMAQADGKHKVALQKCEALSGDAQKACKDEADADYDLAKADAKLASQKQQP
jgi:hypothetical protein